MADGQCDWGEIPHARNHILTTLSPPASVELCDEHYGPGLIPLLAAELGLDPGDFYSQVERIIKREAAKADRALADAQAAEAAKGSQGPAPADDDDHQGDGPAPNMYEADNPVYATPGGDGE